MLTWFTEMDLVGQIYALIAIPATLALVVQTALLLFGIGAGDGDADFDPDADLSDLAEAGDGGLVLFSLRGILAMAAIGGWSGLVMHEAGISTVVTVILSVAIGFMALVGIAWMMKISMKLQSSGNLNLGYAIGRVGTVYIPIPGEMKGSGKINLTIQERFIEIGAVTSCERKLMTGESVRVVATDETGLVVVEPIESGKKS
ncbi:MAG: hypothetical protein IJ037_05305 [Clostridia bacterium]|nr:hypothetical protein [Clostridia bacterium]MBQ8186274.1 hypothetical protein [Clostridia bacterium]MBQ8511673.1 hypothetical protein [Clostridia bacterium]